jgi:hypothetical protein
MVAEWWQTWFEDQATKNNEEKAIAEVTSSKGGDSS